ncbi:hypothetical protein Tco_1323430, partial [Tanacetum coccineum]
FNHSGLVFIFGRWVGSVSSNSKRCISSGIRLSSIGYTYREAGFCLEELKGASRELESPLEKVEEDLDHHGFSYET